MIFAEVQSNTGSTKRSTARNILVTTTHNSKHDIRRGAIEYWVHQKEYSKKYTGYNH